MLITDEVKLQIIKDSLLHSRMMVTVTSGERLQAFEELLSDLEQELDKVNKSVATEWIVSARLYGAQTTLTDLDSAKRVYKQWIDGVHDYDDALTASPDFSETITLTEHDKPTGIKTELASKTITYQQMM